MRGGGTAEDVHEALRRLQRAISVPASLGSMPCQPQHSDDSQVSLGQLFNPPLPKPVPEECPPNSPRQLFTSPRSHLFAASLKKAASMQQLGEGGGVDDKQEIITQASARSKRTGTDSIMSELSSLSTLTPVETLEEIKIYVPLCPLSEDMHVQPTFELRPLKPVESFGDIAPLTLLKSSSSSVYEMTDDGLCPSAFSDGASESEPPLEVSFGEEVDLDTLEDGISFLDFQSSSLEASTYDCTKVQEGKVKGVMKGDGSIQSGAVIGKSPADTGTVIVKNCDGSYGADESLPSILQLSYQTCSKKPYDPGSKVSNEFELFVDDYLDGDLCGIRGNSMWDSAQKVDGPPLQDWEGNSEVSLGDNPPQQSDPTVKAAEARPAQSERPNYFGGIPYHTVDMIVERSMTLQPPTPVILDRGRGSAHARGKADFHCNSEDTSGCGCFASWDQVFRSMGNYLCGFFQKDKSGADRPTPKVVHPNSASPPRSVRPTTRYLGRQTALRNCIEDALNASFENKRWTRRVSASRRSFGRWRRKSQQRSHSSITTPQSWTVRQASYKLPVPSPADYRITRPFDMDSAGPAHGKAPRWSYQRNLDRARMRRSFAANRSRILARDLCKKVNHQVRSEKVRVDMRSTPSGSKHRRASRRGNVDPPKARKKSSGLGRSSSPGNGGKPTIKAHS